MKRKRRCSRSWRSYHQQPAPELSEATQTWIEGRDDLRGKPNYLFPHLSNDQVAVSVDKYLRSKGVQEGSPNIWTRSHVWLILATTSQCRPLMMF